MPRFIAVVLLAVACAGCGSPDPDGDGNHDGEPVIHNLEASPPAIASGGESTIAWSVSGADALALAPGIGAVTGSNHVVAPLQTTAYTLSASNAAGTTTASTTVTVRDEGGEPVPLPDTIAYVRSGGDEIRLIDPDGTHDRALWQHGLDDPSEVYEVWSLSWKPDASELAFASTHENYCSLNQADIFAVRADGTDDRRLTEAPACADLEAYAKGTVRVPVENITTESFAGFLYFQGAPSVQPVSLPAFGSGVVTFTDVADFGGDYLQIATVIDPPNRAIDVGTAVSVEAGGVVTTGPMSVYSPDGFWEAFSPTWRADGASVGYAFNFNSPMRLSADPEPLAFGERILAEGADVPDFILHVAYGPTAETANQLLFEGLQSFASEGIYLSIEGGSSAGEPLLSFDSLESVLGLAWLPDGSGFVYSVTEGDYFGEDRSANLFVYDIASAEVTRLTSLVGDFTGLVAVSGDGEHFVFERSAELGDDLSLADPDLWRVDRDGEGLRLLVADAYAPAWSW